MAGRYSAGSGRSSQWHTCQACSVRNFFLTFGRQRRHTARFCRGTTSPSPSSGMPQLMARIDHLLSPVRLELLFLRMHKFCHFRVWYRYALSGYVREVLLDPRTLSRPYLERRRLEAMIGGHLKGDRNYTTEIH